MANAPKVLIQAARAQLEQQAIARLALEDHLGAAQHPKDVGVAGDCHVGVGLLLKFLLCVLVDFVGVWVLVGDLNGGMEGHGGLINCSLASTSELLANHHSGTLQSI